MKQYLPPSIRNKKSFLPCINIKCTKLQRRKFIRFLIQNDCYNNYLRNVALAKNRPFSHCYLPEHFIYFNFYIDDTKEGGAYWSRLDSKWCDFYKKRLV